MAKFLLLLLHISALCLKTAVSVDVVASVDVTLTSSKLFTLSDGSCDTGTIDSFVEEAVVLHNALLEAYANWQTDIVYRMMFNIYLGINFDESVSPVVVATTSRRRWTTVQTRLNGVATFLSGGGLVGSQSQEKPSLFCSDSFATESDWDDLALDGNGDDMVITRDENGNPTSGYTIADVYPHIRGQGANIRAYWVAQLKGYTFATGVLSMDKPESLCYKPTRQGLTSRIDAYPDIEAGSPEGFTYASFNRHTLLCPRSFTNVAGINPHGQPTVKGLVTSAKYPNVGDPQAMDYFGTLSCTLYHELFHVVDATGSDSDNGLYGSKDIMIAGMNQDVRLVNAPEPYVLVALAAYMYQNPPSGKPALFYFPNAGWQKPN